MEENNGRRAKQTAVLLFVHIAISLLAPVASYLFDYYLKVAAVKIIYAVSFVIPYFLWKRNFKPVGSSYKKYVSCEYKKPAFFIAFAAIVAVLQINIVLIEMLGATSAVSGTGMFGGFFGFLFSLVMYAVVPAITEEMFFRGALVRMGGGGIRAALLAGVMFGLCRYNPYQLVYCVGTGVVLSVLFIYTGDIKMPVYLHLSVNTAVLLLSYLGRICSVGVYVAIECIMWLAILGLGIYYSYVLLRDHLREINEKTKEVMNSRTDISLREIFSAPMIAVYVGIVIVTVLRFI